MTAIVISGGDVILHDSVLRDATLIIESCRITEVRTRPTDGPAHATRIDARGALVTPGFIDVHVHGVEGFDVLGGAGAVREMAARLPRYGVTAFCPTTVACSPADLAAVLVETAIARGTRDPRAARVLPAHLESNFINPRYCGAQPPSCLRHIVSAQAHRETGEGFTGEDILGVLTAHRPQVGIVTLAPELEGGIALVRRLVNAGLRVSIGHSGASYEQALEAIDAGVRHATHLYNRMTPMTHRAPGVPGAVFDRSEIAAEIISDGVHVHPALVRLAVRLKGAGGVMAISDGTAGAGLPPGAHARLGHADIVVGERVATLADGTLAGSVVTMNRAFGVLIGEVGLSLVEAARLCATTPAAELGLDGLGRIEPGAVADLALVEHDGFRVRQTLVGGVPALEH